MSLVYVYLLHRLKRSIGVARFGTQSIFKLLDGTEPDGKRNWIHQLMNDRAQWWAGTFPPKWYLLMAYAMPLDESQVIGWWRQTGAKEMNNQTRLWNDQLTVMKNALINFHCWYEAWFTTDTCNTITATQSAPRARFSRLRIIKLLNLAGVYQLEAKQSF